MSFFILTLTKRREDFNMKITMKTKTLLDGLTKVKETLEKSERVPICMNIKFHATKKGLNLVTDNTVNSTEHFIPSKENELSVDEVGSVMIPPLIIEIVRKMGSAVCITVSDHPDEKLTDQKLIKVTSVDEKVNANFKMQGLSAVEFPQFVIPKGKALLQLDSSHFLDLLNKTLFAASTDENTPILTGVNINLTEQDLVFTTTNRHRLAIASYQTDSIQEFGNGGITIAAKPLEKISRLIGSNKVDISLVKGRLVIKSGNTTFSTTILEGSYPDVSRIRPDGDSMKVSFLVHRTELLASLERQYIVKAEGNDGGITLIKTNPNNAASIELKTHESSFASVAEEIFVQDYVGDEIDISINTRYFLDAIKAYHSKMVRISFTGELSPVLIEPQESKGNIQIILPYRRK